MIHPAPKPQVRKQKPRFWQQKDPEYRRAIRAHLCLLHTQATTVRLTPNDYQWHGIDRTVTGFLHNCWGPIDPAHVGKHAAQGVEDFGNLVPLCRAAHRYYDEHRKSWAKVTGYTDAKMKACAAEYAVRFLESGGLPEVE